MCFSANPKIAANEEPRSIAAGKRRMRVTRSMSSLIFQSTLPVGGATGAIHRIVFPIAISIHAPRGGSDDVRFAGCRRLCNFNPRSPWGERRRWYRGMWAICRISIHAPRGGSDRRMQKKRMCPLEFQSTLPVGGATDMVINGLQGVDISIHAPRGGSDPDLLLCRPLCS